MEDKLLRTQIRGLAEMKIVEVMCFERLTYKTKLEAMFFSTQSHTQTEIIKSLVEVN